MNPDWKNFLLSAKATFKNETTITFSDTEIQPDKALCPVTYLGIIKISGNDAAKLLQGQITCNINDISHAKSSIGALCNPKGRVLSTFLLVKSADDFLMILPKDLIDSIQKRLQMYILRSTVTIENCSEQLCLFGLNVANNPYDVERFSTSQTDYISVNLCPSQQHQLIIAKPESAIKLWTHYNTETGFKPTNSNYWRYLDLLAGIPWITSVTTEEFIPQMLNLDELDGISYTKGCYTGQEIVARTHYLGKAKRALFLAECQSADTPPPNSSIYSLDTDTDQAIAKVLFAMPTSAQTNNEPIKQTMLIVLQVAENANYNLIIKSEPLIPVTLLAESL